MGRKDTAEAYLKMAGEYAREAEKWDQTVENMRAASQRRMSMEAAQKLAAAVEIRDEMCLNARAMRRRAEKAGQE